MGAVLGGGGLVTGLVPLAAAGALGVLGRKLIKLFILLTSWYSRLINDSQIFFQKNATIL